MAKLKDLEARCRGLTATLTLVRDAFNYSRYVLDWKVSADISAVNTRDLLLSALAKAKILGDVGKPEVFSDGGPENDNADVAGLGGLGLFTLTLAQIDVTFSNSLIEASCYAPPLQILKS